MGILIFLVFGAISVYLFVHTASILIRRSYNRRNDIFETNLGTLEVPLTYPLGSRLIGDGALLIFRDKKGAERTIPITSIQSAHFEDIKARRVGVIKLAIPKSPTGGFAVGGLMATVGNEDESFAFEDVYMEQGMALYNHIQTILSAQGTVTSSAPAATTPPALTEELLNLKSLLDAGALTETEFQTAKEKLLK